MKYAPVILLIAASVVFGQSNTDIQKTLAAHLERMAYFKYDSFNPDSVEIENKLFKTLLFTYLSENPGTITDKMEPVVKAGLIIAGSDDNLFRIYSWDTQTGGTMRFYDNLYQFVTGNDKITVKESQSDTEGDPKSWYSEIYSLRNDNKIYYLAVSNSEYSTSDIAQNIKFFNIENNTLDTELKLAKTSEGKVNTLGVNFNFFKLEGHNERPLKIVTYNTADKTISLPVVSNNGSLTGKFILYKFKKDSFEKVNNY